MVRVGRARDASEVDQEILRCQKIHLSSTYLTSHYCTARSVDTQHTRVVEKQEEEKDHKRSKTSLAQVLLLLVKMFYTISLGPTHIQMRFMVRLCLLHVSHLVCGAAPSSQTIRAATSADGHPNRRHSARPQGARGLTPTRRATTPVLAWSSKGPSRRGARGPSARARPLGYSLRWLTGSYRYHDT